MELLTRDTAAAGRFYAGLFGWRVAPSKFDPCYTEFYRGDAPAAGMMAIRPEMGEMPPSWRIYWQVADADATAAKAKSLGVTICAGPQDIPTVGRFAMIQDPQGAVFSVIRRAAS